MPVLTRSCGRNGVRSRIEDPTPQSTNVNRARKCRTTAKRKIFGSDELEPPSKKSHIKATSTRKPIRSLCEDPPKDVDTNKEGTNKCVSKIHRGSRIPRRCATMKTKADPKLVNESIPHDQNLETTKVNATSTVSPRQSSKGKEQCSSQDTCTPETSISARTRSYSVLSSKGKEQCSPQDTCTPETSISARTRSYSALRRSYRKKKQNQQENKENNFSSGVKVNISQQQKDSSPIMTDANFEEIKRRVTRSMQRHLKEHVTAKTVSVQDVHVNLPSSKEKEKEVEVKEVDESQQLVLLTSPDQVELTENFYKTKFYEMLHCLKEIQNSSSKAQQSTQQNVAVYDAYIQELKQSLMNEKEKTATLDKELRESRESLEQTKEELEIVKAVSGNDDKSKGVKEKRDLEKEAVESHQGQSTDQSIIKFYAMLTGISLSREGPTADSELFDSYHCVYQPKGSKTHAVCFRLTHDKEYEDIEYSPNPTSPGGENLLHSLPEYLRENIIFSPGQAPTFLSRLQTTVQNL